ncbi:MAG: DUF2721 domain-containing protein [Gammaproteobacteria bacterium]|nr:DUF2721 domain-containing protein [Gammaproteobacteria bacterium]
MCYIIAAASLCKLMEIMMPDITLTTPALLFPAISLLLVAYTNRFNALTSRIRSMSASYKTLPDSLLMLQMQSLRRRVCIIRNMQGFGIASLFMCVICMFTLFGEFVFAGKVIFAVSLMMMLISLAYSLYEVLLSVHALNLELNALENHDIR